jgi:hypothetical protein
MPKGAVSKDGKRKARAAGFQPGCVIDANGEKKKIPDLASMPLSYTMGPAMERLHRPPRRGLVTVVFSVPEVQSWSTTVCVDDVEGPSPRMTQTLIRTLAIQYANKAYGLRHCQTNRRPHERDIVKAIIAHWSGQVRVWEPVVAELRNVMVAASIMGS